MDRFVKILFGTFIPLYLLAQQLDVESTVWYNHASGTVEAGAGMDIAYEAGLYIGERNDLPSKVSAKVEEMSGILMKYLKSVDAESGLKPAAD